VTLSTSERLNKTGKHYAAATVFCAVLSAVYEALSHGVYSPFMVFLFLIPLLLGVLPFGILKIGQRVKNVEAAAVNLWNAGAATLTAGSLIRGIMDIYGTTTPFAMVYLMLGLFLLAAGAGLFLAAKGQEKTENRN
jgi:hypothetical protein